MNASRWVGTALLWAGLVGLVMAGDTKPDRSGRHAQDYREVH